MNHGDTTTIRILDGGGRWAAWATTLKGWVGLAPQGRGALHMNLFISPSGTGSFSLAKIPSGRYIVETKTVIEAKTTTAIMVR